MNIQRANEITTRINNILRQLNNEGYELQGGRLLPPASCRKCNKKGGFIPVAAVAAPVAIYGAKKGLQYANKKRKEAKERRAVGGSYMSLLGDDRELAAQIDDGREDRVYSGSGQLGAGMIAGRMKKEKKAKKADSEWTKLLRETKREYPGLPMGAIAKLASKKYKK